MKKVQSVLFDKELFSMNGARKWIAEHGYKQSHRGKYGHLEGKHYRFRQKDVDPAAAYKTIKLTNYPGVKLIIDMKIKIN